MLNEGGLASAEKQKPYVAAVAKDYWRCLLCAQCADNNHLEGKNHRKASSNIQRVTDMMTWHDVPDEYNDNPALKLKEVDAAAVPDGAATLPERAALRHPRLLPPESGVTHPSASDHQRARDYMASLELPVTRETLRAMVASSVRD